MKYQIVRRPNIEKLIKEGNLEIGQGTKLDEDIWLCHSTRDGKVEKVAIGKHCTIRSGAVIYSGVKIGDNVNLGHDVTIREFCSIGNNSSIGTGVKVECYTTIGNFVSIETQSHITGWMKIEDYVFIGGAVMSTNDLKMKWKRQGHGQYLKGPTVKHGAQIGSGAVLLPEIVVGKHAIVNAGEIVRKNVPDNHIMFTSKGKTIYKKIKPDPIRY